MPDSDWESARTVVRRNFQRIDSLFLGVNATPTFASVSVTSIVTSSLQVSGLTASRLTATDGSKNVSSVANLASWIAGTTNQITVTNDGDGTVTLSIPATPTFAGLIISETVELPSPAVEGKIVKLETDNRLYFGKVI